MRSSVATLVVSRVVNDLRESSRFARCIDDALEVGREHALAIAGEQLACAWAEPVVEDAPDHAAQLGVEVP
jgi:hypothetical protein